jgi:hypothetical protein
VHEPREGGHRTGGAGDARPDGVDPGTGPAGGLRGLPGQVLDLAGDHAEALTGLAGPGGLDGGVEGEQAGLGCDGGDRDDDVLDGGGRLLQLDVGLPGGAHLGRAATGDVRRGGSAAGDLGDRRAHLLDGGREGLHVGVDRGRDGGTAAAALLGGGRGLGEPGGDIGQGDRRRVQPDHARAELGDGAAQGGEQAA